ncbi:MAG: NlpC/P60 family protein [Actinobacteria bacterium]|nr:NlpC/P60 family protein [Actinomycetota bacterium]
MSNQPYIRRSARRFVLAAALATAGVSTLALPIAGPLTAHAAPASIASVQGRARQADAVADQAAQALALAQRYQETGDAAALTSFEQQLDLMAVTIANRVALDPAEMQRAWAEADLEHQTALVAALSQLGVAYRRNTSKPGVGFDCSGLTSYAWAQAGFDLTRQSSAQIRAAAPRELETAMAGDLVQYPGHVMMYLGVDRAVVHAVMPGRPVEVDVVKARRNLKFGDPTD